MNLQQQNEADARAALASAAREAAQTEQAEFQERCSARKYRFTTKENDDE